MDEHEVLPSFALFPDDELPFDAFLLTMWPRGVSGSLVDPVLPAAMLALSSFYQGMGVRDFSCFSIMPWIMN